MKDWIVSICNYFKFKGDKILAFDNFLLSQDQSILTIKDILINPLILEVFGKSFPRAITNSSFFVQRLNLKENDNLENLVSLADNYLNSVFFFLWFAKDNSCSFNTTTGFSTIENKAYQILPHTSFFKADCSVSDTVFDKDDIDLAFRVFTKSSEITKDLLENQETLAENSEAGFNMKAFKIVYKNLNRIDRATRFLKEARQTNILAMKISYYVLTLECLFSSGNSSELQHRLGERIALYIGENQEDCIKVYNDFTTFYDVRSRYMHGSEVADYSEIKLNEISVKLDSLLRKIFLKVMLEDSELFLSDSKEQKKYFLSQLFKSKETLTSLDQPTD